MLRRGDTTPEDKREQEERVWRDKRRWATKRELEAGADSGAFLSHTMHSPLGIVWKVTSTLAQASQRTIRPSSSKEAVTATGTILKHPASVGWISCDAVSTSVDWALSPPLFCGNLSSTEQNLLHPFANPYIKDIGSELSLSFYFFWASVQQIPLHFQPSALQAGSHMEEV